MRDLFHPGGPLNVRRTGPDLYEFSVTIPPDADGMRGHECPARECTPAYFKVRPGTGLTGQSQMYCPYCRTEGPTRVFLTHEQVRYATDEVKREATSAVSQSLARALGTGPSGRRRLGVGLVSMEITYSRGPSMPVRPPREEPLRRDVRCPHCTLEQSVFGLAIWCSDCGRDIFTTHVAAELSVLRVMLDAVPERRERLGRRVAARDVEDALENSVSVFEAVMKFITRRHLLTSGRPAPEVNEVLRRTVRSAYQSIQRGDVVFRALTGRSLFDAISDDDRTFLANAFEKRHPIAHNLGVVDRAYIAKAIAATREGREVVLYADEVRRVVDLVDRVLCDTYVRLFDPPASPTPAASPAPPPGAATSQAERPQSPQ